jgi:peptidoglycan/LPS O-acetylase OafA/YrhL
LAAPRCDPDMKTTRFVALDSWRGVCALLVAIHNLNFGPWLPQVAFVAHSSLFVDFFFVLSGFVISHAYINRLSHRSDVIRFIVRRIGRLWPLHVAMLAALIGLLVVKFAAAALLHSNFDDPSAQDGHNIRTIVANLLLIQAFDVHSRLTWNAASWSISTELWTYILFAATCVLAGTHRTSVLIMGGIAVMAAGVLFLFSPYFLETNADYAFFRCLYGFFVGHLTYRAWQVTRLPSGGLLEILVLMLVVFFVLFGADAISMVAPLIFGFAVMVFAREKGWISDLLTRPPFVQLGRWSYSIYMVHWLFRDILLGSNKIVETLIARHAIPSYMSLSSPWTMRVLLVGYLVGVVALAAVTYRLIEQPGRAFFNKISDALLLKADRRLA